MAKGGEQGILTSVKKQVSPKTKFLPKAVRPQAEWGRALLWHGHLTCAGCFLGSFAVSGLSLLRARRVPGGPAAASASRIEPNFGENQHLTLSTEALVTQRQSRPSLLSILPPLPHHEIARKTSSPHRIHPHHLLRRPARQKHPPCSHLRFTDGGPAMATRSRRRQRPLSLGQLGTAAKAKRQRLPLTEQTFVNPDGLPEMFEVKADRVAMLSVKRDGIESAATPAREISVRPKKPRAGERIAKGDGSVVLVCAAAVAAAS